MTSGIYALIDQDRGRPYYIGKSRNVERRISAHKTDWNSQYNLGIKKWRFTVPILGKRLSAMGFFSLSGQEFEWELLEETDELDDAEAEYVDLYLCDGVVLTNWSPVYARCNGFGSFGPQCERRKFCDITANIGYPQHAGSILANTTLPLWRIPMIGRLNRDRSDLVVELLFGRLTVRQAAIEAGFRKQATPIQKMLRWVPDLTEDEWQQLVDARNRIHKLASE
jgi:hypothetical protein